MCDRRSSSHSVPDPGARGLSAAFAALAVALRGMEGVDSVTLRRVSAAADRPNPNDLPPAAGVPRADARRE